MTQDLTLGFAQVLAQAQSALTFCLRDRHEHRFYRARPPRMGAREGRDRDRAAGACSTNAYMFRPGGMKAMPGQRNLPALYRWLFWIYLDRPRPRAADSFCKVQEVARAMIVGKSPRRATRSTLLEVADIVRVARG